MVIVFVVGGTLPQNFSKIIDADFEKKNYMVVLFFPHDQLSSNFELLKK